jgi:hypothetical protein
MDKSLHENSGDADSGQNCKQSNANPTYDTEPLTVTIEPFSEQQKSYKAKHYRLDRHRYGLEKKMYRTAHRSLSALAIYTGLTFIVAVTSVNGSCYTKKALELTRKQLAGTEGARIIVTPAIELPNSPESLSIGFSNEGRVFSPRVDATVAVSHWDANGKLVGKRQMATYEMEQIQPTKALIKKTIISPFGADRIIDGSEIVTIETRWRFDDGFGTIYSQSNCAKIGRGFVNSANEPYRTVLNWTDNCNR